MIHVSVRDDHRVDIVRVDTGSLKALVQRHVPFALAGIDQQSAPGSADHQRADRHLDGSRVEVVRPHDPFEFVLGRVGQPRGHRADVFSLLQHQEVEIAHLKTVFPHNTIPFSVIL